MNLVKIILAFFEAKVVEFLDTSDQIFIVKIGKNIEKYPGLR